jgi:hypothetical protein
MGHQGQDRPQYNKSVWLQYLMLINTSVRQRATKDASELEYTREQMDLKTSIEHSFQQEQNKHESIST